MAESPTVRINQAATRRLFNFTAEDVKRALGWTHIDRLYGTGFRDQEGELRTWYDAMKAMPETTPAHPDAPGGEKIEK